MSRFSASLWKVTSRQAGSWLCRPATAMGEGCQASRSRGPGGGAAGPDGAAGAAGVRAPAISTPDGLFAVAAVVQPSVASAEIHSKIAIESGEIRRRKPLRNALLLLVIRKRCATWSLGAPAAAPVISLSAAQRYHSPGLP